jgi:hypothetical protein
MTKQTKTYQTVYFSCVRFHVIVLLHSFKAKIKIRKKERKKRSDTKTFSTFFSFLKEPPAGLQTMADGSERSPRGVNTTQCYAAGTKEGKGRKKERIRRIQECRSRVSRQEIKGANKRNHLFFSKFPPRT